MPQITLLTLQCTTPDEIDMDEVFLKFNKEKIWPENAYYRLDSGDKIDLGISLNVAEDWVAIELWDFDYLSRNDYLGVFKFKPTATSGKYSTSMTLKEKNSTASYLLTWQVD